MLCFIFLKFSNDLGNGTERTLKVLTGNSGRQVTPSLLSSVVVEKYTGRLAILQELY